MKINKHIADGVKEWDVVVTKDIIVTVGHFYDENNKFYIGLYQPTAEAFGLDEERGFTTLKSVAKYIVDTIVAFMTKNIAEIKEAQDNA